MTFRMRHVWKSKPAVTAVLRPEGGSLSDLLGYRCPFVWECEVCGTQDVRSSCAEKLVEAVHDY